MPLALEQQSPRQMDVPMTLPDYQTLMLPVLELAAQGEQSVPGMEAAIAARFHLTDEERQAMLQSGRQRVLHNRTHWAKSYLTKAGLVQSTRRGYVRITPAGQAVLDKKPVQIDRNFLLEVPSFAQWYAGASGPAEVSDPAASTLNAERTPEEAIDAAHAAILAELREELLNRILQNDPGFFEGLIVDLLVAMGYGGSHKNAAERLGKSGDGDVDGVINEDILGLDRIYVQAKRHAVASVVGRPDIQAFTGSLIGFGASKGVFFTTSSFSSQAQEFASRVPQRIILIDGRRLPELMIEHGVGVRTSRVLEFKRVDEDFFAED